MPVLDQDLREPARRKADHHAWHTAIADNHIRGKTKRHHRNIRRQVSQKIGEIVRIRRCEQKLRRPADP